jgi:DNA-3-methyladenine glycosylase II
MSYTTFMHADIVAYFEQSDAIIADIIKRKPELAKPPTSTKKYLESLCRSIIGQQLSVRAAETIWKRTTAVIEDFVDTSDILAADTKILRSCGLSHQKISYIRNIAEAIEAGSIHFETIDSMSDEQVTVMLSGVKGIGIWTAEMFLLFSLARPDVFSGRDLGLRRALGRLYGLTNYTAADADQFATRWTPYRSYAARALWASHDM